MAAPDTSILSAGTEIHWWGFAAGIGLFLFGLYLIEQALQVIAGRSFKRFIRRNTRTPLRSVVAGTIATAILQSSSVVGLTVLAFVGAGLVTLRNALGVIFGSNLGTTFTGWLIVLFGFKLSLEAAALPLVAVGCLTLVTFREAPRLASTGRVVAGAGFVLLGLGFMKSGATNFAATVDLTTYAHLPLPAFLGLGVILTAIIQSSSAMMMIALSAMYAGMMSLEQGAAVMIGANLGTTGTLLLGAWGGSAAKKRVALAHFLFNFVTMIVAYLLLVPMLYALSNLLLLKDPLVMLVAYHSLFNLLGVALFLPCTAPLARFLEQRFRAEDLEGSARFISSVDTGVHEAALAALGNETEFLLGEALLINRKAVGVHGLLSAEKRARSYVAGRGYEQGYAFIKRIEGDIHQFALKLQAENLEPGVADRLNHLLAAVRNGVHSTKSTRDVRYDLHEFERSVSDYLAEFRERLRTDLGSFYARLEEVETLSQPDTITEILIALLRENNSLHDTLHEEIRHEAVRHELTDTEVSTLFNVNREIYNSNRELILAHKDCRLPPGHADAFMSFPGVG